MPVRNLSRRELLERAGLAGAGAVLAQIPGFLSGQGWLEQAHAQSGDEVRETLDALVAFVVPGPDPYSVAQRHSTKEPGGIEAGATDLLIELLDRSVKLPGSTGSGAVAQILNGYAQRVNPAAAGGGFTSAFARLRFNEKIELFRQFEQDTEGSALRYLSGILIGATAFLSYTEGNALDRPTRRLTRRPTGWRLTRYDGVAEGRPELKGYWRGRRSVRTSSRYEVRG